MVRRWWIDDLALVDWECGPCSGTRQRRQLSDTDGEFVVVLMARAGRETVRRGDAEAELKPGLARAREDLMDSDLPVSAIAHRWGFADPSHFTRTVKAHYGASPRECRTAGRSVQLSGA